jgi:hypothetical protein
MEGNSRHREQLSMVAWKLAQTLCVLLLTIGCAIAALCLTRGKGEQGIVTVAGFLLFAELAVIWKPTRRARVHCPQCGRLVKGVAQEMVRDKGVCPKCKLRVNCPQCGQSLKGATWEMVGDIGVCAKCLAEFEIVEPGH